MKDELRELIAQWAELSCPAGMLTDRADLYAAGLSSMAAVQLMMAIEGRYGIVFPDEMLTRALFQSIDAIAEHIMVLQERQSVS